MPDSDITWILVVFVFANSTQEGSNDFSGVEYQTGHITGDKCYSPWFTSAPKLCFTSWQPLMIYMHLTCNIVTVYSDASMVNSEIGGSMNHFLFHDYTL